MNLAQHEANLVLDESRLASSTVSERGDIFLLNYLRDVETALQALPEETIRTCQTALQTSLLRLVTVPATVSNPLPKPGKPVRQYVARCLVLCVEKGDSKPLYDIMQALLKASADPKMDKEVRMYVEHFKSILTEEIVTAIRCSASLFVTGRLMRQSGSQILSVTTDIASNCVRIIKTSSYSVNLRTAALQCLTETMSSAGKAINEALSKDISKVLRNLLSDKMAPLQRGAAAGLLSYYHSGVAPLTIPDLDAIMNSVLKVIEFADFETRNSLARLTAGLLAYTQIEGSAQVVEPAKRKANAKDGQAEDEDPYPTVNPAAEQPRSLYTLSQMLNALGNPFNRPNTSRKCLIAIFTIYATLLSSMGPNFVDGHYPEILRHLLVDIGSGPRSQASSLDALTIRKGVNLLLRQVVGVRSLSEQSQIMALREIAVSYLGKYPAMLPGQTAPPNSALLLALEEAAGLLEQLGSAPTLVQDALNDPLIRLTNHPAHNIQIAAAFTLKQFCFVAPSKLSSTTSILVELLNKDLSLLVSQPDIKARAMGHAYALMALISLIPSKPLYISYDVSARIMSLAIQLLKDSGNHELATSKTEITIAWMLVAALMYLGPSFIKVHLPQLLILWKNALPKASSKDASAAQIRSDQEWAFLLSVRQATLSAILSFLVNAPKLISSDVGRRIAVLLSNAFAFDQTFQTSKADNPQNLLDLNTRFKTTLLKCHNTLPLTHIADAQQQGLLLLSLKMLSDPDVNTGSLIQAAIASNSGATLSIWDSADGLAYGVTSHLCENGLDIDNGKIPQSHGKEWLNRDTVEAQFNHINTAPLVLVKEHDPLVSLCENRESPPLPTHLVDTSLITFTATFPNQTTQYQSSSLADLMSNLNSPKMERNAPRRMAALVNACVALLLMLRRVMTSQQGRQMSDAFQLVQLNKPIATIAKECLLSTDNRTRLVGSELLGRLTAVAGVQFMSTSVQMLVDCVVTDTAPSSRAGCALSLGSIFSHVGAMSAGPLLKTIVDLLTSLANDPHPLVHFWAVHSLSKVVDAASLTYAPFTNACVALITRLYFSEAHEVASGNTVTSINARADLPVYVALTTLLDALVNVLGPELAVEEGLQRIVLSLIECLQLEDSESTQVQAIQTMQHFLIFCPDVIPLPVFVQGLRLLLSSSRRPLKTAAINSVYQLVQRSASSMSKLGGNILVEELFALLDDDPSIDGVRETILSWLKQTVATSPSGWIDLCQRIMLRSIAGQNLPQKQAMDQGSVLQFTDEESQGLGLDGDDRANSRRRSTSRWRTQLFALECVHQIFVVLQPTSSLERLLSNRVPDLIKMAFGASTSDVPSIRLAGLEILSDVLKNFAAIKDPHSGESLLEQYQAPIMASLTPAFEKGATPEVTGASLGVCAVFVATAGDPSRMTRVIKVLTGALESCKDSGFPSIGGVDNTSSTASALLRISVLAAWAELYAASNRSPPLKQIVQPFLDDLASYWLASLREYAKLRAQNLETSSTSVSASSMETGLDKDVVLQHYSSCWTAILRAIATLLRIKDAKTLKAMNNAQIISNASSGFLAPDQTNGPSSGAVNGKSQEPAAFFHVLLGIAFENLATASSSASIKSNVICLQTLEGVLVPELAAQALFEVDPTGARCIYDELISVLARVVNVESPAIRLGVLATVKAIAQGWAKHLASNNRHLMALLGIAMSVIQNQMIALQDGLDAPALENAISTLLAIASHCSTSASVLANDITAVALALYGQILKLEVRNKDVVSNTLPVLKLLTEQSSQLALADPGGSSARALHGLISACLQNVDEVLQREGDAAMWKAKVNVLAAAIIVAAVPSELKLSQAVLDHLCSIITTFCQDERSDLKQAGLYSAKSLFTASGTKNTTVTHYCIMSLVPNLITIILQEDASPDVRMDFLALLKTFVSASASQKKAAMDVVLPIYLAYLSSSENKDVAIKGVIELASLDAVAFRQCTQDLDASQRGELEFALRSTVQTSGAFSGASKVEPTINLKAFG